MVKKHKIIFSTVLLIIFLILGVATIFGFIFYNNHFYARRVLEAIEQEDITKLEKLMKAPFGNLNCKPNLWIVEVLSEESELTPLQAACRSGNLEIVKMLVENGADVNYTHWDESRNHGSPLTNAASSRSDKRLQVIEFLVENGADVTFKTSTGDDALSCVVYASFDRLDTIEIIEFLEQNGADVYQEYPGSNNTLLHKACERNNPLVVRYLIEDRRLDVNAVNADGDTPLIHFRRCAGSRDEDVLRFFLQAGADLKVENEEGKTVYDYAAETHPELLKLLD